MSFTTGGFGAGAAAAGLSCFGGAGAGAAAGGFSAAGGGLASSSAMMRRIDARISSIEGSWTFAGCVISDSKSSTPSHTLFYTRHDGMGRFRLRWPCDFIALTRLVPRTSTARSLRGSAPVAARFSSLAPNAGHESLCCLCKGYVRAINDCKQRASKPRLSKFRVAPLQAMCAAMSRIGLLVS
jgi:hypothetical protein